MGDIQQMKALVYTGTMQSEILDMPLAETQQGQVCIDVQCGICGSDMPHGMVWMSAESRPYSGAGGGRNSADRPVFWPAGCFKSTYELWKLRGLQIRYGAFMCQPRAFGDAAVWRVCPAGNH